MCKSRVSILVLMASSLVLAAVLTESLAQPPAAASATPSSQVGDDDQGRLPPGYAAVVTRAQRAKIYSLQDKYQKDIDALNKQIEQLTAARDKEVESVLDEKQKEIVQYVVKLREKEREEETKSKAPATKATSGN